MTGVLTGRSLSCWTSEMSSSLQPEPTPTYVNVILCLALLIPAFWFFSLLNGVEPFACPPGTKTIRSPTSIEKWCVEV